MKSAASEIQAIVDDPNEPFETADEFISATYEMFAKEMTDEPIAGLWAEAALAVKQADHDGAYAALDALDGFVAQARERLRSIEDGTAFRGRAR
jgi:hypothetical protein